MNRIARLLLAALIFSSEAHAAGLQVIGSLARDTALAPGATTEGAIAVRNNSDEPLRVRIYAQDYEFFADGSNAYPPPGTLPRSNASWVHYTPEEMVLPPGATGEVAYTMTAPDVVEPGTWWSMLMIEPAAEVAPESAATGVTVRTLVRYAVQVVAEIGHPAAELSFVGERLTSEGQTATLHVDVANPGTRMLRPALSVQIHDEGGARVATFEADRLRIYPGCSVGFHVPLSGLPAGKYEALVIADAGEETLFGARTTLDLRALAPIVSRAP